VIQKSSKTALCKLIVITVKIVSAELVDHDDDD